MVSLLRVGVGLGALAATGVVLTGGGLIIRRRYLRSSEGADGHSDLSTKAVNSVKGSWVPHTDPIWNQLEEDGINVGLRGQQITICLNHALGVLQIPWLELPYRMLTVNMQSQKAMYDALLSQLAIDKNDLSQNSPNERSCFRAYGHAYEVTVGDLTASDTLEQARRKIRLAVIKAAVADFARVNHASNQLTTSLDTALGRLRLQMEVARLQLEDAHLCRAIWGPDTLCLNGQTISYEWVGSEFDFDLRKLVEQSS